MTRGPTTGVLRPINETLYAVDKHKESEHVPSNAILMSTGVLLEKFLTLDKDSFSKLLYSSKSPPMDVVPDSFNFAKVGDFMLRAQLDASDASGKVFDLKTRAIHPIRMDVKNYERYLTHRLKSYVGRTSSFEREYYDMLRAPFIKYK